MTSPAEAYTISRDAIITLINAITAIPEGDPSLPEVLEFVVGRKEVRFSGPLRKAQALVALSQELRQIQSDLSAANLTASSGSSFVKLGMTR